MADGSAPVEAGSKRVRTRRMARPIAVYLFVLALVALVPAFIFSAVLLQRNNEAQERVVETLITGNSRAIIQAVDREINANITTLRVLATTGEQRFPALPAVPTLTEAAVPGFTASIWTGLSVRAGTPPAAIEYWRQAFAKAMTEGALRERLDGLGVTPAVTDPAAFGAMMREDLARWQRVVAPLNISLD